MELIEYVFSLIAQLTKFTVFFVIGFVIFKPIFKLIKSIVRGIHQDCTLTELKKRQRDCWHDWQINQSFNNNDGYSHLICSKCGGRKTSDWGG